MLRRHVVLACMLLASVAAAPRTAFAFDTFGHPEQVFFSLRSDFVAQNAIVSQSGAQSVTNNVSLMPGMALFVHEKIFVGLTGLFGVQTQTGRAVLFQAALGPALGLNIPVAERASIVPKIEFQYEGIFQSGSPTPYYVMGNLYLPMVFHVTPHFSVGIGPQFRQTLWGKMDGKSLASVSWTSLTAAFYGWL